jgi:hypothetical protein
MKMLSALCFLIAAGLAALEHADRTSATALTIVEWSQRLGVPLYAIASIAGVMLALTGMLKRTSKPDPIQRRLQPAAPRPVQTTPQQVPLRSVEPDALDWQGQVRFLANELELGRGARLTMDTATTSPFTLHLEHLSPAHCKRAITALGTMVIAIPTPPRLKIIFDHCPKGGAPRHHQVAGSLAQVMPRGNFKVVSHIDTVDVIFLNPAPEWSGSNPQD